MSPVRKRLGPTTVHLEAATGIAVSDLRDWAQDARRRLGLRPGRINVSTVSPAVSRSLNRRYRRRRRSANILTFNYHPGPAGRRAADDRGDLLLCPAVIRTEARRFGQSYRQRMKFLLHHGLIHLLGLDHQTPAEQRRWRRYERLLQSA